MGLAESQKFLARLSTDPALRARFASDPVAVATEFGLSFDERRSFEELTPGPITGFAGSLIGKRRGEVESLLPLTVRALGPDRFARLFRQHAANFVPAGIKKHRDDAVTFARWLAREVADPAWLAERVVAEASHTDGLQGLFTSFRANTPWLFLNIDRDKVNAMGVSMDEVFNTLQVYLGSLYVNDFNRFGRTWQVNVQGDSNFRKQIEDLKLLKIRNQQGGMAPFGAMASVEPRPGPVLIMRYNMYPAAAINGQPAPGVSSGQAIALMADVVKEQSLSSMRPEWTELALLQLDTGNTAMIVFALAVVLVFLVLAAQYESWSLPFSVILVVPMCLLCSVIGVQIARMDINIFTQIGFIVLVGLACKNAILIVEFAKARREEGVPRYQATLDACMLRLRPIMMTSFAFILGVVPLVLSEGAGSEMRRALGTAVFSGMLGVTLFGIFLTPVFYFVIQWINDLISGDAGQTVVPETNSPHQNGVLHEVEAPSGDHVAITNGTQTVPTF